MPVVFVMHGGGWNQGTHTTDETWLLWPLHEKCELVIISVEYRMAPEVAFPTWFDDSWDVLERLLSKPASFVSGTKVDIDLQKAEGSCALIG